jgi:hypothetical protein
MKQYCICLLFLQILFNTRLYSQEIVRCATTEFENILQKKYPSYKKSIENMERLLKAKAASNLRVAAGPQTVYTVPVVVHILYNSSLSNISDDRILSQIKVINEDYSRLNADSSNTPDLFKPLAGKAGIRFMLANRDPQGNVTTGIVRKYVSNKSFLVDNSSDDSLLKSISRWPTDQYLNIWVTTLSNNQNNKVLGYTFNPGSYAIPDLYSDVEKNLDGVVVDYTTFGVLNTSSKYNLGRTTTHEIGHWLGLRHIWGDSYCGNDYVDDTPLQDDNNLNMNKDQCVHYSTCTGASTLDMSDNYMDYSPDKCMNIFTLGQVGRMRTVMETNDRRISIQNSPGYCDLPSIAALPLFQGFEESLTNEYWTLTNPGNNNTFGISGYGGFGQSKYSMMIENTGASNNSVDYYQSVPVSFLQTENPVLEFSIAYAANNANLTDSLVLSYNSNCHDFIPFKVLYAGDLVTTGPQMNFSPATTDWKTVRIFLTNFPKKISQIRIENYSKGKNNLFLDDLNIYDAKSGLQVVIFPNPAMHELTAEIIYQDVSKAAFSIYNCQGKLLKTVAVDTRDSKKRLNVSEFAAGLYILKAEVDGKTIVKKFLVEN